MMIDSATVVELVNFVAGILILAVAIYAQRKFRFAIFKLGWDIIAASGAFMAIGSLCRAYCTYAGLYEERVPKDGVFFVISKVTLVIGIYVLAVAAVKLWDEKGDK